MTGHRPTRGEAEVKHERRRPGWLDSRRPSAVSPIDVARLIDLAMKADLSLEPPANDADAGNSN